MQTRDLDSKRRVSAPDACRLRTPQGSRARRGGGRDAYGCVLGAATGKEHRVDGKLEIKGFFLVHDGDKSSLARRSDGAVAFDIAIDSNVLYGVTTARRDKEGASGDAIMAALEAHAMETNADEPHQALLLQWHQRLGHLAFHTIERMARDPASSICLSSIKRMACVPCLEGKQMHNAQSQQDSDAHSPSIASAASSTRT